MQIIDFEGYIEPKKFWENLYFVGTRPASTHIIDTGEGLILIDPGYPHLLPQILENIRVVGLDPMDIRIILLSHGHFDHSGATKELVDMTGAKVYVGEGDVFMVTGEGNSPTVESYKARNMSFFTPDVILHEGDHIVLGNTDILCLSTPGHTAGTMSFFFDVYEGDRLYRAGMFGGAGLNTLTREAMLTRELPFTNRDLYFESVHRLLKERVDVFLGNHVGNNDTIGKLARLETSEVNPFIAPEDWSKFLLKQEKRLRELIAEDKANADATVDEIQREKLIMIVRGVAAEEMPELAEALWRGGVRALECTYDSTGNIPDEDVAELIRTLVSRFEGQMIIGAGTVLTKKQVVLTARAGGKFVVSPDVCEEVIKETRRMGMVSIPGAFTPTEASSANRAGADFVKLFPASVGGAAYLKTVKAPLSHVRFLAVGGVRSENVAEYFASGASGIGVGLGADDREALARGDLGYIEEKYKGLISKVKSCNG